MQRFLLIILITISVDSFAQKSDTINQQKFTLRKAAVPLAFFATGAITWNESHFIDRTKIVDFRQKHVSFFDKHIDDYAQYVPALLVYGLHATGIKGKNTLPEATILLIKSELLTAAIVQTLKYTTDVERPDHSTFNSFPSGHTSQAFVAATFLHKEFGHKSIWYSVGGYTIATGIGAMRVLGNRHWLADVLVGAGTGILCTEIVYATHQFKWSNRKVKVTTLPNFQQGAYGVYISLNMN